MSSERIGLQRETVDLQIKELTHEGGGSGLTQGIACGDVYFLHSLRQTVDHRLQQFLVAEHNRRFPSCGNAFRCEPLTHEASLNIFRRGRDIGEFLRWQFLRILIEDRLPFLFHPLEEHLLHLLQMVEAHEGVGVVTEVDIRILHHLTVEGSLVTDLLTGEPFVEEMIDGADTAPQSQEPLFQFTVMILGEVAEEASDHLPLFVGEVGDIVEFMDIPQVLEHLICRAHVLIQIVEVGQEQLSPAVEVIQGLIHPCGLDKDLVQFTDE